MTRSARCVLLLTAICAQSAACAPLLPDRVAAAARERVDTGDYPALAIGYVEGDKSEIVVFGTAGGGVTLDADTVFEIGSITKTMTATVLAQDVRSGNLALDTPVATLLPDFKIPSRSGKPITLLDLATQSSGLPRVPTNMMLADPADPYADYGPDDLEAFLAGYDLPRAPGEAFEYSNLGFGLLGFAIARHAHAGYGDLLDRRLFQPLSMTMSGTALREKMRAHLAVGHRGGAIAKNWTFDALAGAGAVLSSTKDMLVYLRMNMGQIELPGGNTNPIAHQARRDAGGGQRIGLAWMNFRGRDSDIVWHNGGTGGYRSFLGFRTDGRRGVVILTNTTASVDDLGFAALLDDAPLDPAHRANALDAEPLRAYWHRISRSR